MALEHDSDSALAAAVRKAGSQSAFGRLIGKRQSVVNDWLREDRPLPAEYVRQVEQELGISRHELRPDIYPPEEYAASPTTGAGPAVAPPVPALAGGAPVSPSDGAPA